MAGTLTKAQNACLHDGGHVKAVGGGGEAAPPPPPPREHLRLVRPPAAAPRPPCERRGAEGDASSERCAATLEAGGGVLARASILEQAMAQAPVYPALFPSLLLAPVVVHTRLHLRRVWEPRVRHNNRGRRGVGRPDVAQHLRLERRNFLPPERICICRRRRRAPLPPSVSHPPFPRTSNGRWFDPIRGRSRVASRQSAERF